MTKQSNHEKALTGLFEELYSYWAEKTPLVPTSEKLIDDLFLPIHSITETCFFSFTREVLPLYDNIIFPIFEKYGFKPFTYRDIYAGTSIMASISSAIERSSLIVIDLATQKSNSVLYELSISIEKGHNVLIIKEADVILPQYISKESIKILTRPHDSDFEIDSFVSELDEFLSTFSQKIKTELSEEPLRLLKKHEYKAAIVSAFAALETTIIQKLQKLLNGENISRIPFRKLVNLALNKELINKTDYEGIMEWYSIRSVIVHSGSDIDSERAVSIVNQIVATTKKIRRRR